MDRVRLIRLLVIASTLALAYGIWYAYSVILVALLAEFGWSRSVLAGAFSVFTLVHGAANPVIGAVCDRIGPGRIVGAGGVGLALALLFDSFIETPLQLFLGFGVFTALAVACCGWVPAVMQVQRGYQDRLGLSLGIVSSGVGVGMLVVVPLFQVLIEGFGWRAAFRVFAAVCALWFVPVAFFLLREAPRAAPPPAPRPGAARPAPRALTPREAARTTPFWLIIAAFVFGNICSQTLHVHQVAFLVDHGIGALVAASVVGVVGTASIVGKTGGGWLADRFERELVMVAGLGILVASVVALLLVGHAPSVAGAYVYAVLLGIGYSATASLIPALVSDRFSGPHFGAIVGMGLLASAMGSAFGPWLAGALFDLTGSYTLPFGIAGACGLIAMAAAWLLRRNGS